MKDKGKLWVDDKEAYIVKRLMDGALAAMGLVSGANVKKRKDIRNKRVKFFYDCLADLIDRELNQTVKARLTKIRDFVVLLLDDDRAYRFRAYLFAVIFANRLASGEFWIEKEDWYLTAEDRKNFKARKKRRG